MRTIDLNATRGLPMYFLKERIGGGLDFKVTFSDFIPAEVGDEILLESWGFRIDEIKEQRPSPLNYGYDEVVIFNNTKCRLIRHVDRGAKLETPITNVEQVYPKNKK